ncbi:MAG: M-like protein Szp [Cyanobacteria bacterium RYN_339]|nr:M-like protein Szp [Cyanobacteria bacterium RYN_339]
MLPTDPRPAAKRAAVARPRRKGPPKRGNTKGARVVSLEISAGLHLALFLAMLALPQPTTVASKPEPKKEPIPIEVAFQPQQTQQAEKVAPPAPKVKPKPEPLPKAQEIPKAKPQVAHAAAIKPKPITKPDIRPAKVPAPKPVEHHIETPKKPDLATMLAERLAKRKKQEEERAAQAAAHNDPGTEATPNKPAAGTPHGNPITTGSGLSGALRSRGVERRVDPAYPARAMRMGEEGDVTLRLYVAPSGSVSRVEVIRSSGHEFFDGAARSAASRWGFTPVPDETGQQYGDVTMSFKLR